MLSDYKAVPVDVARQIGQRFEKCVVVIIALDDVHGLTHTATWGKTAVDKICAARLGTALTVAAGSDINEARVFENFESIPAAEAAATIERLTAENAKLRKIAAHVPGVFWMQAREAAGFAAEIKGSELAEFGGSA